MVHHFDYVVVGGGIVGCSIAAGLVRRGFHVALVERGSSSLKEQQLATPSIVCSQREHFGSKEARNHLLGGNGYFWGGGLIRPPLTDVASCLGLSENDFGELSALAESFDAVERFLDIFPLPERKAFRLRGKPVDGCDLSEIVILPGRARNIARRALTAVSPSSLLEVYSRASLVEFRSLVHDSQNRKIQSVVISVDGIRLELIARNVVISAGTIDSNLILLSQAKNLGTTGPAYKFGSRIHDHLSLPLFQVRLPGQGVIRDIAGPRFRGGNIVGRRFELQSKRGWGARGFLHFTMQYDSVSPYREIKRLLYLRQQGASISKYIGMLPQFISCFPNLVNIGWERFFRQRLYLDEKLTVKATLDFESFPHPDNFIQIDGDNAQLSWNIHAEDEESFVDLFGQVHRVLTELGRDKDFHFLPLFDGSSRSALDEYLRLLAVDAFHLGGGVGNETSKIIGNDFRVKGLTNLFVISSAIFLRPGTVNPTHSLLAMADRFVRRQPQGVCNG